MQNRRLFSPTAGLLGLGLAFAQRAQASEELTLEPDPQTLLILIAVFLLLIAPVNLLLFRPVFRVLEARRERIAGAAKRAAHLSDEAGAVTARYEDAIREARETAEGERRRRLDEARREQASNSAAARSDAERQIEAARVELDSALAGARSALRAQAEELAREAAQRVLGRPLS